MGLQWPVCTVYKQVRFVEGEQELGSGKKIQTQLESELIKLCEALNCKEQKPEQKQW